MIEAVLVWDPTKRLSAASLFTCAYFDAVRIPSAGIAREGRPRAAVQFDCYVPFTAAELKGLTSSEQSALRRQARVRALRTRSLSHSPLGSSALATIEDGDEDAECFLAAVPPSASTNFASSGTGCSIGWRDFSVDCSSSKSRFNRCRAGMLEKSFAWSNGAYSCRER